MVEKNDTKAQRPAAPEPAVAPGTGRAIVIGTILGFFVVGGFCGGVGLLLGLPPVAAIALGCFTGLWGGPGFGGMMGFVLHESKLEAEHEAAVGTSSV